MTREWFLWVQGRKEGPYSVEELKKNPHFTPDTLVWKKGYTKWVPAGSVKELNKIFKDEEEHKEDQEPEHKVLQAGHVQILSASLPPNYFFWWIILILLILIYSFYRLYFSS
jgi:hypothetical protein